MPSSRQPDAGSTSGVNLQSANMQPPSEQLTSVQSKDAPASGQREDGSKSALAEFQMLLSSAQASQPAVHEQSEQLLQQFLKWGQTGATNASQ
jgi:hypothetical protein